MIFIQSDFDRTRPHHFDCACAMYGCIETGKDYRLTSFEEIKSGKFDNLLRNRLFIGSTEFMQEVFNRAGVIHKSGVTMNSNRECEIITLQEAFNRVSNGSNLFIKPVKIKLFTGLILDGMKQSCLESLPLDTMVMAYTPFNQKIISEWRIYVYYDKYIDSRNYSGDFTISPDYDMVKIFLYECKQNLFPIAYTLDVGILEDGSNVVIEYNDMWSIGNYGIANDEYLKLLRERYFEIVRY